MRLTRTTVLIALATGALTLGGTAAARESAAAPDLRSSAFYIVDAHDSTVLAARNEQKAARSPRSRS